MNLYTDINFSCDLIKNETTVITYSGELFKKNSDSVTIVYGYTDNWNNTTEQKMVKTKLGFVAQLNLLDYDKINFCFRNSNYEWDNNNNQNYGCKIEEKELEVAFIINENIIEDIINNLFKNNISEIKINKVKQVLTEMKLDQTLTSHAEINEIVNSTLDTFNNTISENINTVSPEIENTESVTTIDTIVPEIEDIEPKLEIVDDNAEEQVAQIIPDIKDIINFEFDSETDTTSYFDIPSEPKELVDIKEENVENNIEDNNINNTNVSDNEENIANFQEKTEDNSFYVEVEKNGIVDIQETLINETVENDLTPDIENIFDDFYEIENIENTKINNESSTQIVNTESRKDILNFDMDSLVNEILSPIIESSTLVDNPETTENISDNSLDCSDLIKTIDNQFDELKKEQIEEAPLMDVLLNIVETTTKETPISSEPVAENHYLVSPRSLGTFYMIRKKIKLIFYKIFGAIPKFLFGDYDEEKN